VAVVAQAVVVVQVAIGQVLGHQVVELLPRAEWLLPFLPTTQSQ
jgi:hypothetical protein